MSFFRRRQSPDNPYRDDPRNAMALDLLERALAAKTLKEIMDLQEEAFKLHLMNNQAPAEHAAWYLEGYLNAARHFKLMATRQYSEHMRQAHPERTEYQRIKDA